MNHGNPPKEDAKTSIIKAIDAMVDAEYNSFLQRTKFPSCGSVTMLAQWTDQGLIELTSINIMK